MIDFVRTVSSLVKFNTAISVTTLLSNWLLAERYLVRFYLLKQVRLFVRRRLACYSAFDAILVCNSSCLHAKLRAVKLGAVHPRDDLDIVVLVVCVDRMITEVTGSHSSISPT
jgi:hypothetical protein